MGDRNNPNIGYLHTGTLLPVSRRSVLQALLASASFALPQFPFAAIAQQDGADASMAHKPAIVVRSTENITEGSWVWLLDTARDAGVVRIYLLMKQDENEYESGRTERTWHSGELLAPLPGGVVGEGWDNPAWLDEFLPRAREYGIEVHAWWPCFQDAVAAAKMPHARYAGQQSDVFLDPAYPEVRYYQAKLLRALLERYPFDGVALDWLRYNERANGSDGPLAAQFAGLAGKPWSQEAMAEPNLRAMWDDLRAREVAGWVHDLLSEIRPLHPNVAWSAFVLPWMFKEVAQSYRHLSAAGLDSLQPMIYWRDWNEDASFTSDVISPAPFYLSGRTSLDPAFDITGNPAELTEALSYLPVDRLGMVTWYHHDEWSEEDFRKLTELTAAFNASRSALYAEPTPVPPPLLAGSRLEPASFSPDASLWALVCLGELHQTGAQEHAEPIVPVLALHRFSEGKPGSGPSDWHTSTGYLDALIAMLKRYDFKAVPVATVAAYMTSDDPNLLPIRPFAITIDDGSASIASLFEPRAAAAGLPYSAALVTGWVDEDKARIIDMGDGVSDEILSWRQVKVLADTGRVSFISHSHLQHRYAKTGSGGSDMGPAITTRLWIETEQRLETENERLRRVFNDLAESRETIARHTGAAPSILVWPYGIHDDPAEGVAREAGFTHFMEFTGNAFAAPRQHPQRIMRVSVMLADEAVPLTFPQDEVTAQRWWLAFQKWARQTQSVDLIEAGLAQLTTPNLEHPEVWISRAAALTLNGHSTLAQRLIDKLRGQYPHDGAVHAAADEFLKIYLELV
jgi:Polysaccharide deacetylase/Glycosyl hydrolase-like 10